MQPDRRTILGIGAGAAAVSAMGVGAWALLGPDGPAWSIGGADLARGHRLRAPDFPAPSVEERSAIAIVGGGVAGLSAAWSLMDAGFTDIALLELERETGGNARAGRNAVSAYPLGAHYLTMPNREAGALHHFLERAGVITGRGAGGVPIYDPYALCADAPERILWQGRWQEGLIPQTGISAADVADIAAFDARIAALRAAVGSDGRPAFATPMAYSSADPAYTALDAIDFEAWVQQQGWRSPILAAYLRYCMRDDYGCEPADVSAWAGIHYFAGRRGWVPADDPAAADTVLTWPEGNAYLTRKMAQPLGARIKSDRIVFRVARSGDGVAIDSFDVTRGVSVRTISRAAILAVPHFIAARLAPDLVSEAADFSYSPWLVANVTVGRMPRGPGAKLAWDNVGFGRASLGYVVATHQNLASAPRATVLTWYMPLSGSDVARERRGLLNRPAEAWRDDVVTDILELNPDLRGAIQSVALWRWGHAMVRPVPGFITRTAPTARGMTAPPLFLAHSDLSGLSLFEEAHYRGVAAAESAMRTLGHVFESRL